ncbi:MAG: polymerase [Treponema sp.]|jgi:hypothetical protein|nr:polymerase [Treponema sp.]
MAALKKFFTGKDRFLTKTRIFVFALVLLCSVASLSFASDTPSFAISALLNWEQGNLSAVTELNLLSAGIRLPGGRSLAEEILKDEYIALVRPLILSIQVDSSSTVDDLVQRREISLRDLDELCLTARMIPPSISADMMKITGRYTIDLSRLSAMFIRHRQAGESIRPISLPPAANYTGIIIIADMALPIHGRNSSALVSPCLFPKIWDTDMNLIYERNLTDPALTGSGLKPIVHYAKRENIFRPTPSGLDESLIALVGERPLRIFARSVFGAVPTDPVIDQADALLILANENNRRLLREGRVVLVVNDLVLGVRY